MGWTITIPTPMLIPLFFGCIYVGDRLGYFLAWSFYRIRDGKQ
jgi:hypothetical protein